MTLSPDPILTPLTGGFLQPAFPLTSAELGRLLSALRAARTCGADPDALAELGAEEQALCARLGIKARAPAAPPSSTPAAEGNPFRGKVADCMLSDVPGPPTASEVRARNAASF